MLRHSLGRTSRILSTRRTLQQRFLNLDSDKVAPLIGSRQKIEAKRQQFEGKYKEALEQAAKA